MRALLLAAGLGTRLRPLTNDTPKCLMPIKGVPLLEVWLRQLHEVGVESILINTHYLADKVEEFVTQSIYKEKISLVHEQFLLGTAGTLIKNLTFLQDEDIFFIHADNYCLVDLLAFVQAHVNRPKECLMTMMIFRTTDPSACGIVELDGRGIVIGFHEKVANPPGNLANCAVYILSKELLQKLVREMPYASDFSVEVLSQLMGQIFTYEIHEPFVDIGTLHNYAQVNN